MTLLTCNSACFVRLDLIAWQAERYEVNFTSNGPFTPGKIAVVRLNGPFRSVQSKCLRLIAMKVVQLDLSNQRGRIEQTFVSNISCAEQVLVIFTNRPENCANAGWLKDGAY